MDFQLADNLDTGLNRARLHVWEAADTERPAADRAASCNAAAAILRGALDLHSADRWGRVFFWLDLLVACLLLSQG